MGWLETWAGLAGWQPWMDSLGLAAVATIVAATWVAARRKDER